MKPITIEDVAKLQYVNNPKFSPDGKKLAYVYYAANKKENKYDAYLYLADVASGKTRAMTSGGKESDFIWDDAETLLFPTVREKDDACEDGFSEKTVFYRLNIFGGEAKKAFSIEKTVTEIKKMSDGKYAVLAVVDLNKPKEKPEDWGDYHVFEELPFWANGQGLISRIRPTLFVYDEAKNELTRVSDEFFSVSGFDVKDGKILYWGCEYRDKLSLKGQLNLFENGATSVLVPPEQYGIGDARFVGDRILVAASTMEKYGMGQLASLYRWTENGLVLLQEMTQLAIGGSALSDANYGSGSHACADGDTLYFTAQLGFVQEVYVFGADNQAKPVSELGGMAISVDAKDGNVAYVAAKPNETQQLYLNGKALTNVNEALLSDTYVAQAEYVPFTDSDGIKVDGWVLKPFGYEAGKTYPAVLEIHGGPRCAFTTTFFHELQALAGAGYFVLFCNPRGSEGRGEEFADLRGKYGDIDYKDLMEFTDHVLSLYPEIDKKRLGAAGGSYGGFMCNWIEGHTDRFAAIASQRCVSNWVADFGSSEIGFTFDPNEMDANPWTDVAKVWDQSPLKYACNAKTPILFIHSMQDYNCTLDQGVEMFSAVRYFGVEARMCVFEGENHSLSRSGKPRHRIRRLQEIIGWFDKYMK